MANLTQALIIMLGITMMFIGGQWAVNQLNPQSPQFYHCQGSALSAAEVNACNGDTYQMKDKSLDEVLPPDDQGTSQTTGNLYTDTAASASGWVKFQNTITYLYNLATAPSQFLKALHLPDWLSFSITGIWYVVMIYLLVAFIWGRFT
jgi:hypothetical protein